MAATDETIFRGSGILWLTPGTLDVDGAIDGWDPTIPFNFIKDTGKTFEQIAAATGASKTEFITVLTDAGVTVETPKRSIGVDLLTATVKPGGPDSASGGASGSSSKYGKISVTAYNVARTTLGALKAALGVPVLAIIHSGEAVDSGEEYYFAVLGTLTLGEIKTQGETIQEIPITVEGGLYTLDGALAAPADYATITPLGLAAAVAVSGIDMTDIGLLAAGETVII